MVLVCMSQMLNILHGTSVHVTDAEHLHGTSVHVTDAEMAGYSWA